MVKSGPDFYDNDITFEKYLAGRNRKDSPNETLEKPILIEMIGSIYRKCILDLGCGEATIASQLLAGGAQSYTGVDGSKNMIQLAKKNRKDKRVKLIHSTIESFSFGREQFDLVISSLAFHYIEDYLKLLANIRQTLKPGGTLVFSVEHPVITSCNKSLELSETRQDWIVDQYFVTGARKVKWKGDTVTKYHRTIEELIKGIAQVKLSFRALRESNPSLRYFDDSELFERRRRIPLFLFLEAKKPLQKACDKKNIKSLCFNQRYESPVFK